MGIALMAAGLIMILAAGALFLCNSMSDKKAGDTAQKLVEQVLEAADENAVIAVPAQDSEEKMPEVEIDGVKYIGIVSVPKLGVTLPVQADWSLDKLKVSPCRYTGNLEDGSMIICAHNYRSHFGRLGTLTAGDIVYFTDANHLTYTYKVRYLEDIDRYDSDAMKAEGDWDMTLFTCTYNGRARVTARLIRTVEES